MPNLPSESILQSLLADFPNLNGNSVSLSLALLQTSDQLMKDYEAFFSRYGLSGGKFAVLLVIQRSPCAALTPTECAHAAQVSCSTISGLLNGLERKGLISRSLHPDDGRMNAIQLSETGEQLMAKLVPAYVNWAAALLDDFDESEKTVLKSLLTKL